MWRWNDEWFLFDCFPFGLFGGGNDVGTIYHSPLWSEEDKCVMNDSAWPAHPDPIDRERFKDYHWEFGTVFSDLCLFFLF